MRFIKLKWAGSPADPIFINPQHIVAMYSVQFSNTDKRTRLDMASKTPEQIIRIIRGRK